MSINPFMANSNFQSVVDLVQEHLKQAANPLLGGVGSGANKMPSYTQPVSKRPVLSLPKMQAAATEPAAPTAPKPMAKLPKATGGGMKSPVSGMARQKTAADKVAPKPAKKRKTSIPGMLAAGAGGAAALGLGSAYAMTSDSHAKEIVTQLNRAPKLGPNETALSRYAERMSPWARAAPFGIQAKRVLPLVRSSPALLDMVGISQDFLTDTPGLKLDAANHYDSFSRGPIPAYYHMLDPEIRGAMPAGEIPPSFTAARGELKNPTYADVMRPAFENAFAKYRGMAQTGIQGSLRMHPEHVDLSSMSESEQRTFMRYFHSQLAPDMQEYRMKMENNIAEDLSVNVKNYAAIPKAVIPIREKLKAVGIAAAGATGGTLLADYLHSKLVRPTKNNPKNVSRVLAALTGAGLGGAAAYYGGTDEGRLSALRGIQRLTGSQLKQAADANKVFRSQTWHGSWPAHIKENPMSLEQASELVSGMAKASPYGALDNTRLDLNGLDLRDSSERNFGNERTHMVRKLISSLGLPSGFRTNMAGDSYWRDIDVASIPSGNSSVAMHELGHAIDLNGFPKKSLPRKIVADIYASAAPTLWQEHAAWRKGREALMAAVAKNHISTQLAHQTLTDAHTTKKIGLGSYWGGALGGLTGATLGGAAGLGLGMAGGGDDRQSFSTARVGAILGGAAGTLGGTALGTLYGNISKRPDTAKITRQLATYIAMKQGITLAEATAEVNASLAARPERGPKPKTKSKTKPDSIAA